MISPIFINIKKPYDPLAESAKLSLAPSKAKSVETIVNATQLEPQPSKAPDIPLWKAAEEGNIEAVKQHLAAGTDVNMKTTSDIGLERGMTPLYYAVGSGRKEIAKLLIAFGADVNAQSQYEVSPLHWAADRGQKEAVELLIKKGADVNAYSLSRGTPKDRAIMAGSMEIVELLRIHGAK